VPIDFPFAFAFRGRFGLAESDHMTFRMKSSSAREHPRDFRFKPGMTAGLLLLMALARADFTPRASQATF
jgi:hypothetical protein